MARYTGPKHRLARQEGVNILGKESRSLERRLNVPPGIHGRKGKRKTSEYGKQLREKQKLKRIYGLLEKQFRNYVLKAEKKHLNTEEALIQLLEQRLDNLVFRLGMARTRQQARQLVGHGHIIVDNERVNIPSYSVKVDQTIGFNPSFLSKRVEFAKMLEEDGSLPDFLMRKGGVGKLNRLPLMEDVQNPIDYQLVIEFYSR